MLDVLDSILLRTVDVSREEDDERQDDVCRDDAVGGVKPGIALRGLRRMKRPWSRSRKNNGRFFALNSFHHPKC